MPLALQNRLGKLEARSKEVRKYFDAKEAMRLFVKFDKAAMVALGFETSDDPPVLELASTIKQSRRPHEEEQARLKTEMDAHAESNCQRLTF